MAKNKYCVPEWLDKSNRFGRNKYTEKQEEVIDLAKKELRDNAPEVTPKIKEGVTDKGKHALSTIGEILEGKDYDIKDAVSRIFDPAKRGGRISDLEKQLYPIFKKLNKNEGTETRYSDFNTNKRIKMMLDNNVNPNRIPGYSEWTKINGDNLEAYKKHVEESYKISKESLLSDPRALEVHKMLNRHHFNLMNKVNKALGEEVFELSSIDPNKVDSGIELLQWNFINAQESENMRDFYEKKINGGKSRKQFLEKKKGLEGYITLEKVLSDPKLLNLTTSIIIDDALHNVELRNVIKSHDISDQVMPIVQKQLDKIKELTDGYISTLNENDSLRYAYENAKRFAGEDIETYKFDNELDDVTDTKVLDKMLEDRLAQEVMSNDKLLSNKYFKQFVERNKYKYKEVNKLIEGDYNINNNTLVKEITMLLDSNGSLNGLNNLLKFREIQKVREDLSQEVAEKVGAETEKVVDIVRKQFPDYEIVSFDGTKLFNDNGKPVEMTHADWVPGSITGIVSPGKLTEDAVNQLAVEADETFANTLIKNGKYMIIPKDKAKVLFEAKKPTLPDHFKKGIAYKISTYFRKMSIMSPFRIFKYTITGTLGNVYWTLMSDPRAFKHWGKSFGMMKSWIKGDFYEKYKADDPYVKAFVETAKHTGTYMGVDMNELGINIDGKDSILKTTLPKDKNIASRAWKKTMETTAKFVEGRELWHRSALAMAHLDSMENGTFNRDSLIGTNMERIEKETDKYRKAALAAHEQFIDYSDISRLGRKLNATALMFWTFKEGMIKNHYRIFKGLTTQFIENIKTHNGKGLMRNAMKLGTIAIVMGGILNTVWNKIMVATGALSDEDYEYMKKNHKSLGIGRLFGMLGMSTDGFLYLPGTNIGIVDKTLGVGKNNGKPIANTKFNISDGIPSLIPFISGKDIMDTATSQYASMLNPVYKVPTEYATGKRFSAEYGMYGVKGWDNMSAAEKIARTASGFFGASTQVGGLFDQLHGVPKSPGSQEKRNLQYMLNGLQDFKYDSYDDGSSQITDRIKDGLKNLDVEYTQHALADYIRYMLNKGVDESTIRTRIKSIVKGGTLFGIANQDIRNAYLQKMTGEEKQNFVNVLRTQKQFLDSLGIQL